MLHQRFFSTPIEPVDEIGSTRRHRLRKSSNKCSAYLQWLVSLLAVIVLVWYCASTLSATSSSQFFMKNLQSNIVEGFAQQEEWYTAMLTEISRRCKHISHFFHHFLPHKQCNQPLRVGKCKDGSKWICMDEFVGRTTFLAEKTHRRCIVYSFGSSDNSCFEKGMVDLADCEIHIFDPTSKELLHDRWVYHPYGLTGSDPNMTDYWDWRTQSLSRCEGCTMKNLKDIMTELGHDWIDILKIDIDGAEWRSLDFVYQKMKSAPASQLLLELTGLDITDQSDSLSGGTLGVYRLWKNLIQDGFRLFHLEPNVGTCKYRGNDRSASFEYAFWRG
jgi:hypothetical protein